MACCCADGSSPPNDEQRRCSEAAATLTGIPSECESAPQYDFSRSTEDNHAFSGLRGDHVRSSDSSFRRERGILDGEYHAMYTPSRVALQDALVRQALGSDWASRQKLPSERPCVLFTAGPMGAGKSYVMNWMNEQNLLSLRSFVRADPDDFRALLPEWHGYNTLNPEEAGRLTQKEAGLLVELTTEAAMSRGLSVWQDGTLQDVDFFRARIQHMRRAFPHYHIVMLYVEASPEAVQRRVERRGRTLGRVVPRAVLEQSLRRAPAAFNLLAPQADLAVIIDNSDDSRCPALRGVYKSSGAAGWASNPTPRRPAAVPCRQYCGFGRIGRRGRPDSRAEGVVRAGRPDFFAW